MASVGQYGTLVGDSTSDDDLTGLLLLTAGTSPVGAASLQFHDADGSGGYNCPSSTTCDPVYLHFGGTSSVQTRDIRLSHSSETEGRQVEVGDDDTGDTLSSLGSGIARFAFEDIYPTSGGTDGEFNIGEPFYVDTDASGDVTAGDVKIIRESSNQNSTGSSSFTMMTSSDSRAGNTLTGLTGAHGSAQVAIYDLNADGSYNIEDGVYLDVDGDNMITPGDVQLGPLGSSTSGAGTTPDVGDDHLVHELNDLSSATIAYNDADTDSIVDDGEAIYIDADGSGAVSRFDITIGPVSSGSSTSSGAGDQVDVGDSEIGDSLTTIATSNLKFRDNNANSQFDGEDDLYLDIGGSSSSQIEAGDLLLHKGSSASTSAGDRVSSGDDAIGKSFSAASLPTPVFSFIDFNGGANYGLGDGVYIDFDSNNVATAGDLRVGEGVNPMTTFAEMLEPTDSDANYCFDFTFSSAQAGWIEDQTAGTANIDEGIYLDRAGTGSASILDVRLSHSPSFSAGTFVKSADNDQGDSLTIFTPALPLFFYDTNGDTSYSLGTGDQDHDTVYLDVTGGGGNIAINDLRLTKSFVETSPSPGSKVASGHDDINLPLTSLPSGTFQGVDKDQDGTFDTDDHMYLNVDSTAETNLGLPACATPADIRLSGSGGASGTSTGSTGGGGGGGGTTTPTATPPSISITSPTDGSYHQTGTSISISGTASGGDDSIDSVTVTVNGAARSVTGLSSWSASFTSGASKDYTIVATVTDDTGESRQTSVTITTNPSGEAPSDGDDGTDGGETEAEQTAREAKETAQQAEETARQAKEAAEDARDIGQQNQESLNEILNRLNETDQNGASGPGVLAALAAFGIALIGRRSRQA